MKSRILCLLTLALLLATLLGLGSAALYVSEPRDKIEITEQKTMGDRSAAEGLRISLSTTVDENLFWEIDYRPGQEKPTSAEYSFYPLDRPMENSWNSLGVSLGTTFAPGFASPRDTSPEEERGLIAAYNALYRETPNGEERRKIINLSDYYTYYPITGTIDFGGFPFRIDWEDAHQSIEPPKNSELYIGWRINDYFRIPILEGQVLEISISKSKNGNTIRVGSTAGTASEKIDDYYGGGYSAITSEGCYFVINSHTTAGKTIDVSQIKGGYGIYCLPVMEKPEDIDRLSMVYALDPAMQIEGLSVSADEDKLLLWENLQGTAVLHVLDIASMKEEQCLEIGMFPESSSVWSREDRGDLHLMVLGFSRLILVEWDTREGKYRVAVDIDLDAAGFSSEIRDVLKYIYPTETFTWNGEKLVIANYYMNQNRTRETRWCDFYYAVLSKDELLYFASCQTSLNTATDKNSYHHNARPTDIDAMSACWEE